MSKFINTDTVQTGNAYEGTALQEDILLAESISQEDGPMGSLVHDIMSDINAPGDDAIDRLISDVGMLAETQQLPVGGGATPMQGMGQAPPTPPQQGVGGIAPGASPFPPMKGQPAPRPGGQGLPPSPPMAPRAPQSPQGAGGVPPMAGKPVPGGPGGMPVGKPSMPRKGNTLPTRPTPGMPGMRPPQSPNANMGGMYGRRNEMFPQPPLTPNRPRR